jgi:peptidoglycan/xylan/chitin deacetylase (PgdA/CDA1 family)
VLREYHIPFTLFVNTAYLDQHDPFPFDAWGREFTGRVPEEHTRALTSLECRTMLDGGLMELGAHTHTHADFRSRPQALRRDLAECVRRLRTGFGIENPSFAFPFGSRKEGFASDELIEAARYCGVSCALSTECSPVDPQSDPFTWGRYNVFAWDTSATLAAKLAGWYDWAPQGWCGIVGRFR